MSWLQTFAGPTLWAELADGALQVAGPTGERTIPLRRRADGRLDSVSRQQLITSLRELAHRAPWQSRGTLWCALPARGVSLRRFSIPPTAPESLRRVLSLQVEARFPLPPEARAWGAVTPHGDAARSIDGLEEVCVAAVRSDAIAELSDTFLEAGFTPAFTLASLVRTPGFPPQPSRAVALHVGETSSEWTAWDGPFPSLTRSVSCGEASMLTALARAWNTSAAEAADRLRSGTASSDPAVLQALAPFHASLQALPAATGPGTPELWTVTGSASWIGVLSQLLPQLRPGATLVASTISPSASGGAAIQGLRRLASETGGQSSSASVPVRVQLPDAKAPLSLHGLPAIPWPWVARAAALGLALLLFPYAEAVLGRPLLQRRLNALQKDRTRLAEIDRRLDFVDYLAGSQPPYIEALYVIGNAAPQGAKLDSVTMNRRGEVALVGYTPMPQQAVEFRTRLVDSKYFSSVVLEEQAPVQGGPQRVNLRITAQWKGPAEREALGLGPVLPDPAKTNAPSGSGTNSAAGSAGRANAPSGTPATPPPPPRG